MTIAVDLGRNATKKTTTQSTETYFIKQPWVTNQTLDGPDLDSNCLIIQEGLLSVTSLSMCMKYRLTACSSLPRKKCGYVN